MHASSVKPRQIAFSCAVCVLICCLVIQPQRYISSVYQGMLLFATTVAPALFPFFFFTRLLTALGGADAVGKLLSRPVSCLYRAPAVSGYVYVMSVLSGYPVGSRLIADLYRNGSINAAQAKKISTFTSTSGPLFLVGTVGTLLFRNPTLGYILMGCHFLGALLNGLLYRNIGTATPPVCAGDVSSDNSQNGMSGAVWSVFLVGGYIAVFSMVVDVLVDTGIVTLLSKPLEALFALTKQPQELARGIVISCIEITRGCQVFAQSGISPAQVLPWVAAMLSFGGFSIGCQSITFLKECGISFGFFMRSKCTQALISWLITFVVCSMIW